MLFISAIRCDRRREAGAALLVFSALLVVISAAVLLDQLSNRVRLNSAREQRTTSALADARAALIGWSVAHSVEPGRLPWPDRNGDTNYDGNADCVTSGFANGHLLGRLPYAGDASPCNAEQLGIYPRDGAGEVLWYAVSRNLLWNRGQSAADPPLNPGLLDGSASYPWLTIVNQEGNVVSNRVAAVIIAAGAALDGQDRSGGAPDPDEFLDSVTVGGITFDNSDNDLVFIQYPDSRFTSIETDSFNDRLVFITVDELMRKVERRVLGDAAVALQTYRTTYQRYPWLSPYRDPTVPTAPLSTVTGRLESITGGGTKIIDDDADFCNDGVDADHVVVNVTRRTSTTVKSCDSATQLKLDTDIGFAAGHAYNVLPAFNGIWGQREGHIPFIDTGESFAVATGFSVTWNGGTVSGPNCNPAFPDFPPGWNPLGGCTDVNAGLLGASTDAFTVPAPTVPVPAADNAECIWTDIDTVDCKAPAQTQDAGYTLRICDPACGGPPPPEPVSRTYTVSLDFSGKDGQISNLGNVKTRRVTSDEDVVVQYQDTVRGYNLGPVHTVTVPAGNLIIDGIYFDIDLAEGAEFPGYFFANFWHRYIYVKVSDEHVPINDAGAISSDGCTAGADCVSLEIGGVLVRNEIQAAVTGAGAQLAAQDRSAGNLGDYFENKNAVSANDTAERGMLSAAFNDQVRVIRPNPP